MKPTVDNCSVVVFEFVEQKFELQIVIEVFFPLLTYSLQLLGLGLLPSARMNPLRRMKNPSKHLNKYTRSITKQIKQYHHSY